jgi:hypothetical protein
MREISFIVAAVWGASFVIAVTWFTFDERRYRRSAGQPDQLGVAGPAAAVPVEAKTAPIHENVYASEARTPAMA